MGNGLRGIPLLAVLCFLVACGDGEGAAPGGLPSDAQVIKDVMPANDDMVLDVAVTPGKRGEAYLHRTDLNWYFDRGVIVKRKAGIEGARKAVLVVGGLARYQLVGDRYQFHRFLTTYNEYEGIPGPDEDELTDYVVGHLKDVFVGREHRITRIGSVAPAADARWTWHSVTSFSVPFHIEYENITNDTTVEQRRDLIDIRFYRQAIDSPLNGLLATEKERVQVAATRYPVDQVRAMKTLRDGLTVDR